MSLQIKYIRATGLFEFTENDLKPRSCSIIACLDTSGETLEFSELEYGLTVKNGTTILCEKTFPNEGVKILRSDQPCLSSYPIEWEPDMVIDIEVFMEQTVGRVEGSHQLTVPRPPQKFPSWTWNGTTKRWDPPTPHPNPEGTYTWDEEGLSWVPL